MNRADILVIEDDKSIQSFIKITLKSAEYGCILADNGLMGQRCNQRNGTEYQDRNQNKIHNNLYLF